MLHKKILLQNARNNDLLKLKPFLDEEAIVLEIVAGKRKIPRQKMGALLVENSNKMQFKIGSGFSDF